MEDNAGFKFEYTPTGPPERYPGVAYYVIFTPWRRRILHWTQDLYNWAHRKAMESATYEVMSTYGR